MSAARAALVGSGRRRQAGVTVAFIYVVNNNNARNIEVGRALFAKLGWDF